MLSKNPEGAMPVVSIESYVHPSAVIIGNVKIGRNVFIGPMSVLRADERKSSIIVGDNCNVQDGVIIHALTETAVTINENTSLSHGCLIHGPCNIGRNCFIGFKSIIFKSTVFDNVFVGHNVLIENVEIPENCSVASSSIIGSSDSAGIRTIDTPSIEFKQKVLDANQYLVNGYRNHH